MAAPCVKKVSFKKPGQKKKTPAQGDSLRIFYTSLLKQNPNSRMARQWLVDYGCLSVGKAEKILLVLEMEKLAIKKDNKTKNI